jgi:hypothetical protein
MKKDKKFAMTKVKPVKIEPPWEQILCLEYTGVPFI